ncbi:hypothetical protein [Bradyrhizobium sp. RT11b]|uniref:hypothetical protein n=1 Tax=Bradyrhizobium sp. RT11b TaxID=3156332 RepID=UPI003395D130
MPSRVGDEREQRRGLVLGLTLAEVLLLLLFLLLLTLAAQLKQVQARATKADADLEQIKPLQEALMTGGAIDITSVQQLVSRFQHLRELEQEVATLKEREDLATQQSELLKSSGIDSPDKLRALGEALRQAFSVNPNDPPAFLKRSLDVMGKLGTSTAPDQVKPLSQMTTEGEASQKLAAVEAEREKLRTDVLNLMRKNGNGLTYPSCWKTSSGQTEYIFDITFNDAGVQVKDATPARAHDDAWQLVGAFARNADINEQTFIAATKKLANWATGQNCKFYTINRDATGSSNKARYKFLQRTIEQHFYPYYPQPANVSRPKSTAVAAPAEASPQTQD